MDFFSSFLASGDSYWGLATRFRMSPAIMSKIVPEVCDAIWEALYETEMPPPDQVKWQQIENGFAKRWNFPNCVGAIDGKHVIIQNPAKGGSLWHNYKGSFSLNLMALVDHEYKFTYVDIGDYGSNSDSSVFKFSEFGQAFMNHTLAIPPPKPLPNWNPNQFMPHCIVGDEAFQLQCDLMKPYPRPTGGGRLARDQRIFNYRLSRARRIVENAFGILAQRFRIFSRRIALAPKNMDKVVKASCVLHNWLCEKRDVPAMYATLNPEGEPYLPPHGPVEPLPRLPGYHSSKTALRFRDVYKNYFSSVHGAVPWQM